MNTKWFKIIGIVIVVALVGVAILAAVVSAQETSTQGFSAFGQQFNGGPGFGRGGHGGRGGPGGFGGPRGERPPKIDGMREAVEAATAEALGMTVEELEAAHQSGQRLPDIAEAQGVEMADVQAAAKAAAQKVIDAAVADGTLTQEQADMMLQFKGGFGGPGKMGGPPPQLEGLKEATEAAVAETLGMTVEELQAAHEAGQTMPDIAKEKDVHVADIQAAAETAKQGFIEQAVADGTLTQEQADFMLEHKGGPGGPGGPGGRGGDCGGGRHGGRHGGHGGGGFGFGPGGSQFDGEAPASSLDNL